MSRDRNPLASQEQRDKSFFFVAYEGLRESLSTTRFTTVPGLAARQGIVPIITGGVVTGTRQVTIHPFIQRALEYIQKPSAGGETFDNGEAQFIFQGKRLDRDDFGQGRFDYQFSESDSFFGRFTASNSTRLNDGSTPDYKGEDSNLTRLLTISETRIISPRMLNTLQLSFNRVRPADVNLNPEVPPELRSVPGGDPPSLGYGFGADAGASYYVTNRYSVSDDMTFALGSHSLRWGGTFERLQANMKNANREQGVWSFSNLENFLIGNSRQYRGTPQQYGAPSYGYRQLFFGLYLQDDWRVSPQLTLNLGLRWEPYTVPIEVNNRLGNIIKVTDPGLTFGDPWKNHSFKEFSPRLGFAWSPTASGTTSVRGGVGLFHVPVDSAMYWSLMTRNWPNQPEFQFAIPASDPKFFPDALAQIAYKLQTANQGIGQGWDYEDTRSPRAVQFNVAVQRQLGESQVISVGYTGNRTDRATTYGYYHLPPPVFNGVSYEYPTTVQKLNPKYEAVAYQKTNGKSWYNGLLLSFQKRFSAGLQAQVSYTFSKMIDYIDGDTRTTDVGSGGVGIQKNPYDLNAQRALSGYHIGNALSVNYSYDLPFGRGWTGVAGHLASGWQLTGIVRMQDGQPFWITRTAPTALSNLQVANVSPNLVSGYTREKITWGTPNVSKDPTGRERYFDPAAFVPAGTRELGNLGRNTLIGPGLANWNASLAKDFTLTERWRLNFRAEMFNVLNRANFVSPSSTVFDGSNNPSGNAGVITSTNDGSPARQIQLGLKLSF
ncbi:MAG: TonB-dependent receptor [Acidobacteria bacterium]|nr:TonB-dependent receptor [Acidobacteriota bacterium]